VLVAGAGGAAHLAGALAAHSTLPVIGVPLAASPLAGFDALLATVQMPPGVPVATVGVGGMGAQNAGHLAAAILALGDAALQRALKQRRAEVARRILAKAAELPRRLDEALRGR
jgi:phosphoribosylamine--glycine ligase